MNRIFLELFNNAVVSGILIIAVIVVRMCIKKAPKWITCLLWGLVAIKLVLPFHIESMLSLIPSAEPIPVDIEYQSVPQITSGIEAMNDVVNPVLAANFTPNAGASVNPMQLVVSAASVLWVAGMVILFLYFIVSFFLLRKRVVAAENIFENVYLCDTVNSPFIFGIVRPRICLPSGIEQDTLECVLAHERAHLRRLDYIWKPLGFLILIVYWFSPLCWIAYVLLCRDIEFACDELVTRDKDKSWRAAYCQALLDCSIKRKVITACPIAFGEVGVKDRVKKVLHYRKPAVWSLVVAATLCVVVAVCFMTGPESDGAVSEEIAISVAEKWAQAFCGGDGDTIAAMASQEVAEQFEAMGVLERQGDSSYFSFGSSPMLEWAEGITPYQIVSLDAGKQTVDIIYYAWTSEPHVYVWREQITLEADVDGYIVSKETLHMDDISTAKDFLAAYPFGISDTLMGYYEGNDMGEALNNNALLSSSNYYRQLFEADTAACDLLNIADTALIRTEVETSGDMASCGVVLHFPDGSIDISMCRPFGGQGIWVPYAYSVCED